MIEDLIKRESKRPVHLYWGGRRRRDLYLADLAAKWAARAAWFAFTPVLSEPDADWQGATGLSITRCWKIKAISPARRFMPVETR